MRAILAFLGFVTLSAVVGALVASLALPGIALSVLVLEETTNVVDNLPNELTIEPLAQRNNIFAVDEAGSQVHLATFYDQNRVEVELSAMSPFVLDAAVAAEDPRFYEHHGVDAQGTLRAVAGQLLRWDDASGGSSITQQYVKNVLVQRCEALLNQDELITCYNAATETSLSRKFTEMRLALGVEKAYSKDVILRQYLNIAGFGSSVYGVEAAASYYFNTTAAALTLPQAASLIAIVNQPEKFKLDTPDSASNGAANGYADNLSRRNYVLEQMLTETKISQAQYDEAVASPVTPTITAPTTGCQEAGANAFFCDYVVNTLRNDVTFGATPEERAAHFRLGGLDVYTTIDLDVQTAAVTTLRENVPWSMEGFNVGGVITSVEVGTGRVLSMAQNKDYSQNPNVTGPTYTGINYNTDFAYGGSNGFQPGSTYKVFTLAEWLSEGHTLYETVNARRTSKWGDFEDSCNGTQNYNAQGWNPGNDGGESRYRYSALQSTTGSINTGFIGMAKELDLCGIKSTAEAFGVHRADGRALGQKAGSVLGDNEIAPLTMAVAYAGIANNGVTCEARSIDRIVGADGTERPVPPAQCTESVTPEVASDMTYALQRVMSYGTGSASNRATFPRVPMIGKTGTTDDAYATWMTGASSRVATVAGVVNVSGFTNQRLTTFDSGPAATARHRMWPDVMSVVNTKYGGEAFE